MSPTATNEQSLPSTQGAFHRAKRSVALMLASRVWTFTDAIHRTAFREPLALKPSIWPSIVLILAITVAFTRSRKLHHIAAATKSEALEADAIHFRTDIWSSTAVLLG